MLEVKDELEVLFLKRAQQIICEDLKSTFESQAARLLFAFRNKISRIALHHPSAAVNLEEQVVKVLSEWQEQRYIDFAHVRYQRLMRMLGRRYVDRFKFGRSLDSAVTRSIYERFRSIEENKIEIGEGVVRIEEDQSSVYRVLGITDDCQILLRGFHDLKLEPADYKSVKLLNT